MSSQPGAPIPDLAAALREHMASRTRVILGIAGAPGSGKSTFAAQLRACFQPEEAVVVPMDGFHLAQTIIDGTESIHGTELIHGSKLRDRKGAPDTFDIGGYLSLLRRLRAQDEPIVYAPAYRRGLEEPIAASIAIDKDVRLIITEGNYLLADLPGWRDVRELLDDVWFVDTPDELRVPQLIQRHIFYGMEPGAAERWANGPDARNAELVATTRHRASRVIVWP